MASGALSYSASWADLVCEISLDVFFFFFHYVYFFFFLNLKHCISFAKHQKESTTGIHMDIYLCHVHLCLFTF